MFYEQFECLCKKNNTTPTKFTKDTLKLSSSKVTAWKNGSIPKYEILQFIADYFNVTVGFLFDGFNNSTQTVQVLSDPKTSDLDERQQKLMDNYDKLNEAGKNELVGLSDIIAGNPTYLKADSEDNKNVS